MTEKEIAECTFKPKTNDYTKANSNLFFIYRG